MLARRALPQAKLGATNVSVFTKRTTKLGVDTDVRRKQRSEANRTGSQQTEPLSPEKAVQPQRAQSPMGNCPSVTR